MYICTIDIHRVQDHGSVTCELEAEDVAEDGEEVAPSPSLAPGVRLGAQGSALRRALPLPAARRGGGGRSRGAGFGGDSRRGHGGGDGWGDDLRRGSSEG
jgi:hypothetical protein